MIGNLYFLSNKFGIQVIPLKIGKIESILFKTKCFFLRLYVKLSMRSRDFIPIKFFFFGVTLKPLLLATTKCTVNRWNTARDQCLHKSGMFFLSYLLNKHGDQSFQCPFWNRQWQGVFKKKFQKKVVITLFLRNHLKVCIISNLKGLMLRKERCMSHVNDNDNVHIKLD